MKAIAWVLFGVLLGWVTIGAIHSESYLTSDVSKIISLLERIADNTEAR